MENLVGGWEFQIAGLFAVELGLKACLAETVERQTELGFVVALVDLDYFLVPKSKE